MKEYEEESFFAGDSQVTEDELFSDKEKMDNINTEKMMDLLGILYDKALTGVPKVSRSVDETVNDYMSRYSNTRQAAKGLARYQIAKCGTSGFLTGLGGLITLPVAIPANVGSVLYVQLRMIASIAKMGGFDIRSDQVQTMVYACLTGSAITDVIKQTGIKIGEKITEGAIRKIPGKVLTSINQKVGFRMITKFGSKGAVNLVELVPIAGGLIGGTIDVASTKVIAENAILLFIDKEVPKERKSILDQVGETAKGIKESVKPLAEKGGDAFIKAKDYVSDNAKPLASSAKKGIIVTRDKISGGISELSEKVKNKYGEAKNNETK